MMIEHFLYEFFETIFFSYILRYSIGMYFLIHSVTSALRVLVGVIELALHSKNPG